ncbi:MAG: hypothetical protein MR420_05580 [Spirochaetia bacterium]|nr:hypothetical protein [Spirochaetia bacterium]
MQEERKIIGENRKAHFDYFIEESKQELRRRKNALDLETLLQRTQELQTKLIALAVPWSK